MLTSVLGAARPVDVAKPPFHPVLEYCLRRAKPYVPKSHVQAIVSAAYRTPKPLLLLALVAVESHFDQYARSRKGARGCAQVVPRHWPDVLAELGLEPRDLFDGPTCVIVAWHILERLHGRYGSWTRALQHYGGSRKYVRKVMAEYGRMVLECSSSDVR